MTLQSNMIIGRTLTCYTCVRPTRQVDRLVGQPTFSYKFVSRYTSYTFWIMKPIHSYEMSSIKLGHCSICKGGLAEGEHHSTKILRITLMPSIVMSQKVVHLCLAPLRNRFFLKLKLLVCHRMGSVFQQQCGLSLFTCLKLVMIWHCKLRSWDLWMSLLLYTDHLVAVMSWQN